ncbi:MAG TPA: O-antigen ligase family protein [Thermoanaerobaculia bacterium]|nr:O-antigen ligase family protein [Thermoanaerobaculia bacterium]HUM30332.1 O-antigen ligase family protein [Thermoanaerobaculia bacterium]HXK68517.1 O-antigen ligase family protein [Thermoanaerobaculia bacterium]
MNFPIILSLFLILAVSVCFGGGHLQVHSWALAVACLGTALLVLRIREITASIKGYLLPLGTFLIIILLTSIPALHLSYSPLNSSISLAQILSALAFFIVGTELASRSRSSRFLFFQIFLYTMAFLTILSWAQTLADPDRYLFIFPLEVTTKPFGFMPNKNLFSAVVNLILFPLAGVTAVLWSSAEARRSGKHLLVTFLVSLVAIILLVSRSEGAILSAGGALVIFFLSRRKERWIRAVVIMLAVCLLSGYLWIKFSHGKAEDLLSRLEFYRRTAHIMLDHPILGTGLGTYGLVAPRYQPAEGGRLLDKMHNDYLELGVTGGLSSLLILIPALLLMWRSRAVLANGGIRTGTYLGLLALSFHAMGDFPFNSLIITWIAALYAGSLLRRDRSSLQIPAWIRFPLCLLAILMVVLLALRGLAITSGGRIHPELAPEVVTHHLHQENLEGDCGTYLPQAMKSMRMNPYHAPLRAEIARCMDALGDPEAVPMIEEASKLEPYNVQILLVAAKYTYLWGDRDRALTHLASARAVKESVPLFIPMSKEERDDLIIESTRKQAILHPYHQAAIYSAAASQLQRLASPRTWPFLRESLERFPLEPRLLDLAAGFTAKKKPARSLRFARMAYDLDSTFYRAFRIASQYRTLNDSLRAEEWFLKTVAECETPSRYAPLAPRFISEPARALRLMEESYSTDPASSLAVAIGFQREKEEFYTEARKWYIRAIDLDRQYGPAYRKLYDLGRKTGDLLLSSKTLQDARARLPGETFSKYFPEIKREADNEA